MTYLARPFTLPRLQARALFFRVVVAETPVSREELTELFWSNHPPSTARRNLTRLLSYLRSQLPRPDLLQIGNTAVSVQPDRVKTDIDQFVRRCGSDEPADWERAVSMYRGPFLAGFVLKTSPEFDNWLAEEQRRLERCYLEALDRLVGANFHRPAAAIRYAQQYLAVDELAEDIHRSLILLYMATANRSAALQQYETCVRVLERELGVSPLPETRAAYEAARQGQHTAARPAQIKPVWTVLPSLDLPLIGREKFLAALETAYRHKHRGGLILISGEAGVGKTRLMQEFATMDSRVVLSGNNHPSTQSISYHPLAQALRQALPHPHLWTRVPPLWLGELSPMLPELGDHFSDLPPPIPVERQQAQARLREALTRVLLGFTSSSVSLLLCLDDLHWADDATLSWLSDLSRRLADSRVCILCTYRLEEPNSVQDVKRAYRRAGLLEEVNLMGLPTRSIHDILARFSENDSHHSSLAERLAQITGGNTFFILETVRALVESNQLDAPPEQLPLPKTVQETIQLRLARLDPLARQILDAAAVLSPDLETALIRDTAGRNELETADGLDELVRRQLLIQDGEKLAFRHDLVRTAVYRGLTPWRHQALHRRAGDALGDVYAHNPERVAAQRAKHYDAAGEYEQAVDSYELAAETAQGVYAHEEAIHYVRRTLELVPEADAPPERSARLYELLGQNLDLAGRFEDAREAFQQAIAFLSPGDNLGLARLYFQMGNTQLSQANNHESKIHLDKALAYLGDPPARPDETWQRAWLDIQIARLTLLFYFQDIEQLEALHLEVADLVETTGFLERKLEINQNLFYLNCLREKFNPSLETVNLVKNNLELAFATQDPWKIVFQKFAVGFALFNAGELDSAEGYLLDSLTQARQLDFPWQEARALAFLSSLYRRMEDVDRTEKYARLAEEKGVTVESMHYRAHGIANLAWLAYRNGERAIALQKAHKATQLLLNSNIPLTWIAVMILLAVHLDAGEFNRAVEAAGTLLEPVQHRLPADLTDALEKAVENWAAQEKEATRKHLEQAVLLAKKWRYL